MNVKELRAVLRGLEPDLPVCIQTDMGVQPIERGEVKTVWDATRGNVDAVVLLVP